MADDLLQTIILVTSAMCLSAVSVYRLVLVQPARDVELSVGYVAAIIALATAPLWLMWAHLTGSDMAWAATGLVAASAWQSLVIRPFWRHIALCAQAPMIARWCPRAVVAMAAGLVVALVLGVARDVPGPMYLYKHVARTALDVRSVRVKDQAKGAPPTLVFDVGVRGDVRWSRVTIDIFPVDGDVPVFYETRDSVSDGLGFGGLSRGAHFGVNIVMARGLNVAPGKYFAVWRREETDYAGRRFTYRPLRTPVFEVFKGNGNEGRKNQ